ncbi:MAG: AbrB/MazE/SpoVT family DNA-binding domain-containing protein [Anaerolineae bacterium]
MAAALVPTGPIGYNYSVSTRLWEATTPRKIFRTGNSIVVTLPADALDATGLDPGDDVAVVADQALGTIVVRPVAPRLPGVRSGFLEQVDRFIDAYKPVLDALADE